MAASRLGQAVQDIAKQWPGCEGPPVDMPAAPVSRSRRHRASAERRQALLARTIEGEIIPRLMLAHRPAAVFPEAARGGIPVLTADDVAEFARLVLSHDVAVAASFVDALRVQGVSLDTICLQLMTPAARHLGELWKADICDFTDVTVALSRMQQLLRDITAEYEGRAGVQPDQPKALLVGTPGDQHSFGVFIVDGFFRRSGWDVELGIRWSDSDILQAVRDEMFDVIGFSLSRDMLLDDLLSIISSVRKVSRNPSICVMVGGRVFTEQPELVARVGADATAVDGRQAILQLPALLGLVTKRC